LTVIVFALTRYVKMTSQHWWRQVRIGADHPLSFQIFHCYSNKEKSWNDNWEDHK